MCGSALAAEIVRMYALWLYYIDFRFLSINKIAKSALPEFGYFE